MMTLDLMDTLEERFDYLKSEKGFSYQKLADLIGGISGDAIRKAVQRGSLKGKYVQIISDKLGISRTWLEDGKGQMEDSAYRKAPISPSVNESEVKYNAVVQMDSVFMMHVPFVHKYAYAGYLSGFGDPEYLEELPTIPWVVDNPPKGNYITLEVKGDSMDDGSIDSYPDGCLVLCREIQRQHWINKLHIDQWDFVIVHRQDGILLKRIVSHDVEKGDITLQSLNDIYEDFTVSLNDVGQIFNVVQKVLKSKR